MSVHKKETNTMKFETVYMYYIQFLFFFVLLTNGHFCKDYWAWLLKLMTSRSSTLEKWSSLFKCLQGSQQSEHQLKKVNKGYPQIMWFILQFANIFVIRIVVHTLCLILSSTFTVQISAIWGSQPYSLTVNPTVNIPL